MFQPRVRLSLAELQKSKEEVSTPEERAILLERQKYLKPEEPDNGSYCNGEDKEGKPTDLSRVEFTKSKTSGTETDSRDKDETPSISFITLFRFATKLDVFFIVVAIICSIIAGVSTPLNAILMAELLQAMVDLGSSLAMEKPEYDVFLNAVYWYAVYNCLVGALIVILTYLATTLMNISAFNQAFIIRQEYLKATLNQDFAYFDIHKTGGIATKINGDVYKLEEGIGEKLTTFVFYQASFLGSVIMALILGWKLALICLVSFPVTMILVGVAGLIAASYSKKEAVASGKAGAIAEEVISGIRTVYAFSGQTKEQDRYKVHLEESRRINIKKGLWAGVAMGFLYFCIFATYGLAIWFGFKLMMEEKENYNVYVMIGVFFGVMTGSTNFGISSTLMEVFGSARGAGAQIFNMIDNVPTINPLLDSGFKPKTINGNIELRNVVFHYPSRKDVPVLKGVSLSVKRGQSVALVGHSGCGKSTIIQLVSRFYDVIEGSVTIDGHNVKNLSVRWLRDQIGLVGQEPVLFNTTVRENIRYGREDATDEEIEACARQANAHLFIMKLPQGYDTLVGERGASLSGGQKQRIAIARALVRNPSILLLDEATSALDTSSEYKVQKALDAAQEGRTTIVVAHRLSTIRNVDVIFVFKAGQVVEMGNHVELMKLKKHYYDMVMLQTMGSETDDSSNVLTREVSVRSEQEVEEEEILELNSAEDDKTDKKDPDVSFWRVLKLNAPEWKSVTLPSICSLLSGFALPLIAVVFGDLIGDMSTANLEEVLDTVRGYALIFVGIGVFAGVMNFITVFFYGIAGEYLTERLRRSLFEKLLQQEIAFFDDKQNSTGALCAKLSGEAALVQGATGQRIGTVLQSVGTFSFALVLALIYEWRVGLVSLAFVPVIMIVLYKQGRMTYVESSRSSESMEASSKVAVEAVSNVRTVASLGREGIFREDYGKKLKPALELAKQTSHIRGLVYGLSRGIFNFVMAASIYYGGKLIVNEGIQYNLVFKSAQALLMGASGAAQAFAFAPNFQKGIQAAGRIIILLNRQSKIADPENPRIKNFSGTGQTSLRNVRFRYPTRPNIQVLKDFNLEVARGKTVALVGASGCGKSTVIQLLERYYDPDEGIVAQDSVPLPKLLLVDARKSIGFVQQEPVLFDQTIGENIAYGSIHNTTMEDIIESAKQANIHNFIASLPLGYDTNIGSKGTQLSGGQKQRVAIARALIRRPKMLLLDEATSALDTESEKVVQEALDAAKAGRTCVMIAHRLSTVRDADVICVVHDGEVAEMGTHSELIDLKGLYYKLNKIGYA